MHPSAGFWDFFLWTKLLPLLFRKTGLNPELQQDNQTLLTTLLPLSTLSLLDEGQTFTIRGNREWPWQYLKVSLAKYHSPPMSNSEHLGTGTDGFLICSQKFTICKLPALKLVFISPYLILLPCVNLSYSIFGLSAWPSKGSMAREIMTYEKALLNFFFPYISCPSPSCTTGNNE